MPCRKMHLFTVVDMSVYGFRISTNEVAQRRNGRDVTGAPGDDQRRLILPEESLRESTEPGEASSSAGTPVVSSSDPARLYTVTRTH